MATDTVELFETLKDAEEFILRHFRNGEDEVFLLNEYDDEYYVFLSEYDVEEYLKKSYEEYGYEDSFELHMRGLNIYIYLSKEEKETYPTRYNNAELAFENEDIYKKKIHADAEYEMTVSLGYY